MGHRSPSRLAIEIWQAGVAAVDSERLVRRHVAETPDAVLLCGESIPKDDLGKIVVIGAGKAGAGMAAGFERAFSDAFLQDRVSGWVNVPADCVRQLKRIHLHPARPAGVNEPTEDGVAGTRRILSLVSSLGPRDVCVVLISGGGSALLPCPIDRLTLQDKLAVTQLLMQRGASIGELNCIRKRLSAVNGGKPAKAATAGRTSTLIISDVIGAPLDVIASGPTTPDRSSPGDALEILRRFAPRADDVPASVWRVLEQAANDARNHDTVEANWDRVRNVIIGNNVVAVEAAAKRARELGLRTVSEGSDNAGQACDVGRQLAERCLELRENSAPGQAVCLLSGGEPVVTLAETSQPRKGGRNQELVLAAAERLWAERLEGLVILSGGTDGEDGPTNAAGAYFDGDVRRAAVQAGLTPGPFLAINNSYPFFAQTGGLLLTGPTQTNVMDLRVAIIPPPA